MFKRLFNYFKNKKEFDEARKKYIKEEKKYTVGNLCENCKFLKISHWSNGAVTFGCKIDPTIKVKYMSDYMDKDCKYRKQVMEE